MADHTVKRSFKDHDTLGREKFADFLIEVMKTGQSEEGSYTLAIDAPYGSGKTWFLQMLENKINEECAKTTQEVPLVAVRYDAWKYDYFDEPLEPLVEQIMQAPALADEEAFEASKSALKKAVAGVKALVKVDWTEMAANLPGWLKLLPAAVGAIEAGAEAGTGLLEEARKLKRYQSALDNLQDVLHRAAATYGENARLVVIIDELDRCRPDFAIRTLEVTKHLLASENVVFLYAVDMKQLGRAVETMYGAGMDAEGYLLRLFNYVGMLPAVDKTTYLMNALQDLLDEKCLLQLAQELHHQRNFLRLTYRDIDRIVASFRILYGMLLVNYLNPQAHLLYFYLLTLKYTKRKAFDYLIFGEHDSDAENYFSNAGNVNSEMLRSAVSALVSKGRIFRDSVDSKYLMVQVPNDFVEGRYRILQLRATQLCNNDFEFAFREANDDSSRFWTSFDVNTHLYGLIFTPDVATLFAQYASPITIGEYIQQKLEMYNYDPTV